MKTAGLLTVLVSGVLAVIIAGALLNGIMLSYMWEWFVVPLGVMSIGVPQAIGISVLVSMLTFQGIQKDDDGEPFRKLLTAILGRVAAFGIAYGVSFAMPA